MKTKEQIVRYISYRHFEDSDWEAIVAWVRSEYGCGLKKARRHKFEATARDFFDWVATQPGEGDVVVTDGAVGIFHENGKDDYQLAAWVNGGGVFSVEAIPLQTDFTIAEPNPSELFYQTLKEHGYDYSVSLGRVIERQVPKTNVPFKFVYEYTEYIGVAMEVSDVVKFRVLSDGKGVSLNTTLKTWKVDVVPFRGGDLAFFNASLEQAGYIWDVNNQKLISNIPRVAKGEKYYYINDQFAVIESIDKYSNADDARFRSMNYFHTFDEARRFKNDVYKLRVSYQ